MRAWRAFLMVTFSDVNIIIIPVFLPDFLVIYQIKKCIYAVFINEVDKMGYGDAYYYAVVLKDSNVEEYKEYLQIRNDFNEMITDELNDHKKGTPISMRRWYMYDIFINRNFLWDTSASKLPYDNLAIAHVSSDDWLESYRAVGRAPDICTVDYFIDNYSNKAWIPEYLKGFRGHYMTIMASHYDTDYEFIENFKIKEVR